MSFMGDPGPPLTQAETAAHEAEQRAIVKALAAQLDTHDAEHVGAWGVPDETNCVFC